MTIAPNLAEIQRLDLELAKMRDQREKLRAGECLLLIPDTHVACGEGGNFCSVACRVKAKAP